MKQYLLPEQGSFYKANLHCHSTVSDGRLTPEELKSLYKSAGYSVLAYSDHNLLLDHSDLDDEEFLTLTSVEIDVSKQSDKPWVYRSCYHINFYPEDQHNTALPCFNPRYVNPRHPELIASQAYVGTNDYKRDYDNINQMINAFAKHGFIAMLNHPSWSLQTLEEYHALDTTNLFAMEIYNHGCFVEGYNETNDHMYDDLLRKGHKLFCVASDDNHNGKPHGSPAWDSLGGFVMIKAPDLSYKSIYDALRAGSFYASTAPEIQELYIEDHFLHIRTSPCAKIILTTAQRQASVVYATSVHTAVTEAKFDLSKIHPGYVRLTVVDEKGRSAWTQPIWGAFSEQP